MATHRLLRAAFLAALVPVAAIALQAQGHGNPDRPVPALAAEPPMLGLHQVRGEAGRAKPGGGGGSSPNIVWHNGAIMPTATVTPIFWGSRWADPTFVSDKVIGLDSWHAGIRNSSFLGTSNEYGGTNGQVTSAIAYPGPGGSFTDYSTVPGTVSKLTTPTANEVCKMIGTSAPADGSGYYPVYVDMKRGSAGFCAYHSYTTCSGIPVQFAFFFNLDGDSGCDPHDTSSHSEGLAALVNVSAHELSEARTDPRNGGWYDSSGAENADKCAWTFGSDSIQLTNGTKWKMQGNWSNAAYNASPKTGYKNSSDQAGCLDGGNFR